MSRNYYHNDNPFMDTTWESPPSRRPESIRMDSRIGGGGIEFDNFSDSNSSDIFGNESYEYKVSNPTRGAGGYMGTHSNNNNNNNNDHGVYIRSHGNDINNNGASHTSEINMTSKYMVNLKPPNNNDHTTFDNNFINDDIGTTVEHNGRLVRYVNVNDLINKIGFGEYSLFEHHKKKNQKKKRFQA